MGATREIQFEGSGGHRLTGRLHLPAGPARGSALFAHCFTCGKDLRISTRMAQTLSAAGFVVLRFDFTGLGESGGDFAETTFTTNVDDLVGAAAVLRAGCGAPQLLIGHSLGGAAVLAAAGRIPEVRAVATVGAPAQPAHVRKLLAGSEADLERDGRARVDVGGRPFEIGRDFVADLERHDGVASAAGLGRALLVMHSPQDNIVGIENAQSIYEAARHPKSFVSLDGADHLLSRPADAEYAASTIAAWAARYLESAPAREPQAADAAEAGEVVATIGREGLAVDVLAGGHRTRIDEPLKLGGTDTGPTPYDALLSALGACTVMTMRMYADRKGWPLREVAVKLRHGRVHASDCEDCETTNGRVDVIERELRIDADLDEAQRARLLEIADRCPVHRTLSGEIRIRTRALP